MSERLLKATPPIDEWPDLVPLGTPNLPRLDLSYLPSWAGDFAGAVAADTETPPELAAGMVLVACATAAARRLRVQITPGYSEPCNLWVVAALPPGNRKSAVQTAATAPLLAWEHEQSVILAPEIQRLSSERKTAEARVKDLRNRSAKAKDLNEGKLLAQEAAELETELPEVPIPPQLWTSDATPERLGGLLAEHNERMAWLSSEGGVFDLLQGRYSGGIPNLDLVLKAHSGDAERVDRGSRPPVFLSSPLLSLGLSPQPGVLNGLAAKPGFDDRGLLARFLYLLPPSPLGYRTLQSRPIPATVRDAYFIGLHAMLNWEPARGGDGTDQPQLLRLSAEAEALRLEFAQGVEEAMRPGGMMEHCTGWAGKAPGAATRIAGILHGIKHAHGRPWDGLITGETMDASLEIMSVCTTHSLAAMDVMGADPSVAAAKKAWAWIERNRRPFFSIREAFNALRGSFPQVASLRKALEPLEERGYIEIAELPHSGPGRPPSPQVRVRPELVEAWR